MNRRAAVLAVLLAAPAGAATTAHSAARLADAASDAQATFDLGLRYDSADHVPGNAARALHAYEQAAAAGLPIAEFNAGVLFDAGRGIPRDPRQAATWYARAASNGYARAQYNLAQLYATGDGVPRNPAQASRWFATAAQSGLAAAHRDHAAAADPRSEITGPDLVAPDGLAAAVITAPAGSPPHVELVWLAPPQRAPSRFFVSVQSSGPSGRHDVFAASTELSAVHLPLPAGAGTYVWRVYAIADGGPHYAASAWAQFTVPGATRLADTAPRL